MRSDTVTKGKQQAPHRSLFNALGLTEEEMNRPLVGIVSGVSISSPITTNSYVPSRIPVPTTAKNES